MQKVVTQTKGHVYGDLEIMVRIPSQAPISSGFYILGNYWDKPRWHILVRETKSGALARPTGFTKVASMSHGMAFYKPIAPSGYTALGVYPGLANTPPKISEATCVKNAYVHSGKPGPTQAHGIYPVFSRETRFGERNLLLAPNCLMHGPATENAYVLSLPLGAHNGPDPQAPFLNSNKKPEDETPVSKSWAYIPCVAVVDKGKTLEWQLDNSPFYRLVRERYWRLIVHRDQTDSDSPGQDSRSVQTGISETTTNSFHQKYGVSFGYKVGAKGGIPGVVEGSSEFSANFSYEWGYTTTESINKFQNVTDTHWLNTPPRKASALWNECHRFILERADGSVVTEEPMFAPTVSFKQTDYPPAKSKDDARSRHLVGPDENHLTEYVYQPALPG